MQSNQLQWPPGSVSESLMPPAQLSVFCLAVSGYLWKTQIPPSELRAKFNSRNPVWIQTLISFVCSNKREYDLYKILAQIKPLPKLQINMLEEFYFKFLKINISQTFIINQGGGGVHLHVTSIM